MLQRFCLYGFLKNQRYFEPFLFLAFLEKQLTFFEIGLLVAIRSIAVNLLEIPSGAVADLFGRRRSMVLAFCAYAVSFVAFGAATTFWTLAGAMVLFGVGEAFRTGTHKALIFGWLAREGRTDEKTRVYGQTRSWSKYGSSLSALIAAAFVYASGTYSSVFYWSLIPCVLNIVNLASYPADIDPLPAQRLSVADVWHHVRSTLVDSFRQRQLRGLMLESMGFNGLFHTAEHYLQPILLVAALALFGAEVAGAEAAGTDVAENARTAALLVGPVHFVLFLAAGFASRSAHRFATWRGGDDAAAASLWTSLILAFAVLAAATGLAVPAVAIFGFALLHVLQNLWRPILTSRIYNEVDERRGATVLSVESQTHRATTMVLAPLFGFLYDTSGSFWPAALVGIVVAAAFRLRPRPTSRPSSESPS